MTGNVQIETERITVNVKKKRNLPLLLTSMEKFRNTKIKIFENRTLSIQGDSTS
jgi:hypothetical protein